MHVFWRVFLIFFGLHFFSCNGCEQQAPRLRSAERKIVDSLYIKRAEVVKLELDSICKLSFSERVDYAVDSILTLRIEERKKRLGY